MPNYAARVGLSLCTTPRLRMTREVMEPNNPIERVASDWLARRDAGDLSAADREAFETWLNASMIHRVEFLRAEDAWEATLRLKALGAGVQSLTVPPPGRWSLSAFLKVRPREREGGVSRRWSLPPPPAAPPVAISPSRPRPLPPPTPAPHATP